MTGDDLKGIDKWAERLAKDLVAAGESEYGENYKNRKISMEPWECTCHCHNDLYDVKHVMACCYKCPHCGLNIVPLMSQMHEKECEEAHTAPAWFTEMIKKQSEEVPQRKQYEYMALECSWMSDVNKDLAPYGKLGWEAYYIYAPSIGFSNGVTVYMKREIL